MALDTDQRNAAMLRLVYGAGRRRREVRGLKWRDPQPRAEGVQVTTLGKSGKTRVVILPGSLWRCLVRYERTLEVSVGLS